MPPAEPEPSQLAERLYERRHQLLTQPAAEVPAQVTAALEELDLKYEHPAEQMWFVELGRKMWCTMAWLEDVRALGLILMYQRQPDTPLKLLLQNGDGGLAWSSVTDNDDGSEIVASRVALPMNGFDRQSFVMGLEAAARDTQTRRGKRLAERLGELRDPPRDEPPEQWSDRAEADLRSSFAELGLEARPEGRPGRWLVDSDVGPVLLTLHGNGQALVIAHELERDPAAEDEPMGWWMLQVSDSGSRVALTDVDDQGWLVSTIEVVSALPLTPQALAWGITRPLQQGQAYRAARR